MTTAQSVLGDTINAISNAVSPKPKAATKAKAVTATVVQPLDGKSYVSIATTCGRDLAQARKLELDATEIKKQVNISIKLLHSHKVTVGRVNKCPIAAAFRDAMIDGGLSKGTADNYLMVFKEAVKSGKEVLDWNTSRAKTAKVDAKKKEPKQFEEVLVHSFNFNKGESFKALCMEIQNGFEDAKHDSIYEGFQAFLMFKGVNIGSEEIGEKS